MSKEWINLRNLALKQRYYRWKQKFKNIKKLKELFITLIIK